MEANRVKTAGMAVRRQREQTDLETVIGLCVCITERQ